MHVLADTAPTEVEYVPMEQPAHTAESDAPATVEYFPVEQTMHVIWPLLCEYWPDLQFWQLIFAELAL